MYDFGEIRHPSSRAGGDVFDEDSDVGSDRYDVCIELGDNVSKLSDLPFCIIGEGELTLDFLQCIVTENMYEEIGRIYLKKVSGFEPDYTGDFHSRKPKPCTIFWSEGKGIVVLVSSDVTPDWASDFTQKILSLIDLSCPILLMRQGHSSNLQVSKRTNQSQVYCLKSDNSIFDTAVFPNLPSPTSLDGLPASVMTESIMDGRSCIVYVAYTDTFCIDAFDSLSEDFLKVFHEEPFTKLQLSFANTRQKKLKENLDRYL